ncbi:hypothetical protein RB594_001899 [Gaeumannomyces avenae]
MFGYLNSLWKSSPSASISRDTSPKVKKAAIDTSRRSPLATNTMGRQLAISTMSLGRCFAGHTLERRLQLASQHGYRGIELWHEDLLDVGDRLAGGSDTPARRIHAASLVRGMCVALGLEIVCLQPFMHYEALADRAAHARRLAELAHWVDLAHALGTDLVAIPSSFLPEGQVSADAGLIAADLRAAADLCAAADPPLRLTYEALSWGTRVDTWEASWAAVQAADRPNLGICLDTFNIGARIYADPADPSGRTADCDAAVAESMARLVRVVDVAKVFYVQVADGERLPDGPLVEGHRFHVAGQPPRMSWSRSCRLFYREEDRGAYLPVRDIAAAIFNGLGFRGWVSLELFNHRMNDADPEVPRELARRGVESWDRLCADMNTGDGEWESAAAGGQADDISAGAHQQYSRL